MLIEQRLFSYTEACVDEQFKVEVSEKFTTAEHCPAYYLLRQSNYPLPQPTENTAAAKLQLIGKENQARTPQ